MLKAAEQARQEAADSGDTEAMEHWDEQIKTMSDTVASLEDQVNSAWTDALTAAAEDFQNAVEIATKAFEESMSGVYGSFDKMQEAYNQQKQLSELYVSDYKQVYELSKLNRDIQKSIDDTDSVASKKALRDLQEEINQFEEENGELTEHDLQYMRKKYELRLAQIALEEAQNAKSQVRMQRDAAGNWGYVYTADESKTAEAEQNYEDKLYEIQELEQNYLDEMEAAAIQAQVDMVNAINALRREDYESEEEYNAAVDAIKQEYSKRYGYYIDEMNKALKNSSTVYEEDWLTYKKYSGEKITEDGKWRTQFTDTFTAQTTGYKDAESARSTFETNVSNMCTNLSGAFNTWKEDVSEAFKAVGKEYTDFTGEGSVFKTKTQDIVKDIRSIGDEFNGWYDKAKTGFAELTKATENEFDKFSGKITKYKNEIDSLIVKINEALKKVAEVQNVDVTPPEAPDFSGGKGTTDEDGTDDNGDTVTPPPDTEYTPPKSYYPTSVTITADKLARDSDEVEKKGDSIPITADEIMTAEAMGRGNYYSFIDEKGNRYSIRKEEIEYAKEKLGLFKNTSNRASGREQLSQAHVAFATGGYTGEWGTDGRLALLHQKELVLNASDTANFLSAVNIVRDIASMIDLRAAAQQSALSLMGTTSMTPSATQTLQQEVTIHAEFPNATQRTEIEAAFDTLLNRASQFANRKN